MDSGLIINEYRIDLDLYKSIMPYEHIGGCVNYGFVSFYLNNKLITYFEIDKNNKLIKLIL